MLIAIVGSILAFWGWTCGNCAGEKPALAEPTIGNSSLTIEDSGFKIFRTNPEYAYPISVTLSPDGTQLAVVTRADLLVRDLRSKKWVHDFGRAYSVSVRWHPTKPVLIAADGSADKPDYFLGYLSNGKRRQVFRGGNGPVAWTKVGLLSKAGHDEVVIFTVDLNKAREVKSGNFGHKLPWYMFPKAYVRYMSSAGPRDQVAAELDSMSPDEGLPPYWMEMYRRIPGQKHWVRTGMVKPGTKGKTLVWYPRNANWLGDGRLVYLRIYPAEWTSILDGPGINAEGFTAKNRAELWICNATGANQKKITTIWDLRPFQMGYETDWITVDRQGRSVYYLSGKEIRHLPLAIK